LPKKFEPPFVKEVLWEPPFDKEVFGKIRLPFGQRKPEKHEKKTLSLSHRLRVHTLFGLLDPKNIFWGLTKDLG